jgi:hypothetical protein
MTSINTRDLGEHGKYVRVMHFVMPAQQMRGGITKWSTEQTDYLPRLDGHIWLPIDDEHTWVYNMLWAADASTPISDEWYMNDERRFGRHPDDMLPGFKLKKNRTNDYEIDRQMQRTKNYTGIVGINTQDYALQEGMGAIVDRRSEHLGQSDRFIIAVRRRLLEQTRVVESGGTPTGADPLEHRSIRPYDAVLDRDADWEAAFAPQLVAKW